MVDIEEIKAGILEKGIERQIGIKKFRAEVEKKRKEIEKAKAKYRAKFYPKK
ncbi:MAG: hypothetical protein AB1779_02615 [Candidatus Thermoplasmatota archaeon]